MGGKQFISKMQPDLSAYVYSTVFGTNSPIPNISITAFLVDRCQNVYVSGWGGKFNHDRGYPNAGTKGLPITPRNTPSDFSQATTDGNDFYFFVLEKNATSQLFGSFYGQNGGFDDHVDGVQVALMRTELFTKQFVPTVADEVLRQLYFLPLREYGLRETDQIIATKLL